LKAEAAVPHFCQGACLNRTTLSPSSAEKQRLRLVFAGKLHEFPTLTEHFPLGVIGDDHDYLV
jgi:hypothetical protein